MSSVNFLSVAQDYHELYELHRARQDAQLLQMTEERDLWMQFTLDLSRKVQGGQNVVLLFLFAISSVLFHLVSSQMNKL